MENKKTIHDFLSVSDLKSFNDKVSHVVSGNKQKQDIQEVEVPVEELDRERFEATVVKPKALTDDILYQCADIIDGKIHLDNQDFRDTWNNSPNTIDRLVASMGVAYISEDDLPVACANITDPTITNFKGIIPLDYYELKSGFSLAGRLQQEFFAVKPEYQEIGIATELRDLLEGISAKMFITVPVWDTTTIEGLARNGYKLIAEFNTDWEQSPVQLWIN